jgi:hypothetical protein
MASGNLMAIGKRYVKLKGKGRNPHYFAKEKLRGSHISINNIAIFP